MTQLQIKVPPLLSETKLWGRLGFDWNSRGYVHVGLSNSVTRLTANKRKQYRLPSSLRSSVSLTNFGLPY